MIFIACAPDAAETPARKCNGFEALCPKKLHETVFATTHNAMSNKADGWAAYNHFYGIPDQLSEGFRGFMLDIYEDEGNFKLCHGSCIAGEIAFADALDHFEDFLSEHPNEVLVFLFQTEMEPARFEDAFGEHPITQRLLRESPGNAWPSLGALIDAGERVVVLSDRSENAPPFVLDMWAHAVDVDYRAERAADFSCAFFRGDPENALFILNHFITNPLPNETAAAEVNAYEVLMPRATQCQTEHNRVPNFVTVDFFSLGDTMRVVEELNQP